MDTKLINGSVTLRSLRVVLGKRVVIKRREARPSDESEDRDHEGNIWGACDHLREKELRGKIIVVSRKKKAAYEIKHSVKGEHIGTSLGRLYSKTEFEVEILLEGSHGVPVVSFVYDQKDGSWRFYVWGGSLLPRGHFLLELLET